MMCKDSPACSTSDDWEPSPSSSASLLSPAGAVPLKSAGGASCRRQVARQRLQSLHGYVARTVVVTVAASAAMLETMPEGPPEDTGATGTPFASGSFLLDFVTKIPSLLRSALRGVGTYAKEAIDSLSAAIGEPPRRPFEDPDAPSGLPWVADVAIVFCILAVVMFVVAFATMPRDCEGSENPDAALDEDTTAQTGFAKGRARLSQVIVVALLPALAGATLNAKQALIPALLCSL